MDINTALSNVFGGAEKHQMTTKRAKENIIPPKEVTRIVLDVFGDLDRMISCTIGPAGGNTLVTEPYATTPIFPTKDGFRVMNNHNYDDIIYESIYRIIRDICGRMNAQVGDGTTSGIPIANSLYRSVIKYMAHHKELTPYGVKQILDEILRVVTDYLTKKGYVQGISGLPANVRREIYRKVATISANNDSHIADLVAKAYATSASDYTFIDVQESTTEEDTIDTNLGFELTSGYILRHMANNADGITAEFNDPLFLLIDGAITDDDVDPLRQFIEWACISQQRALVVVASEYWKKAMDLLVQCCSAYPMQTARGTVAVKLPVMALIVNTMQEYGVSRMGDLEAALGARALQTNTGRLQNCPKTEQEFMMLVGRADSVTSKPHYTRIRGGAGTIAERDARIAEIETLIRAASDGGTKGLMEMARIETLRRRAGMLKGEMHCIKVGGDSVKEKQNRSLIFEDAILAVKACINNGVSLGGNVSISHCIEKYRADIVADISRTLFDGKTHNVLIGGGRISTTEKIIDELLTVVAESSKAAFKAVFKNATNDKRFIRNTFTKFKTSNMCTTYDLIRGQFQQFPESTDNDTPDQIKSAYEILYSRGDVSEAADFVNGSLPSLLVPGNTDSELLRSVFSILGLFFTSNQLMSVHVQKENKI